MMLETMIVPVHPETKKFEEYFNRAKSYIFKDWGIALINVLVHTMSFLGQEASLENVIDKLKNQGTNLVFSKNTDS